MGKQQQAEAVRHKRARPVVSDWAPGLLGEGLADLAAYLTDHENGMLNLPGVSQGRIDQIGLGIELVLEARRRLGERRAAEVEAAETGRVVSLPHADD